MKLKNTTCETVLLRQSEYITLLQEQIEARDAFIACQEEQISALKKRLKKAKRRLQEQNPLIQALSQGSIDITPVPLDSFLLDAVKAAHDSEDAENKGVDTDGNDE